MTSSNAVVMKIGVTDFKVEEISNSQDANPNKQSQPKHKRHNVPSLPLLSTAMPLGYSNIMNGTTQKFNNYEDIPLVTDADLSKDIEDKLFAIVSYLEEQHGINVNYIDCDFIKCGRDTSSSNSQELVCIQIRDIMLELTPQASSVARNCLSAEETSHIASPILRRVQSARDGSYNSSRSAKEGLRALRPNSAPVYSPQIARKLPVNTTSINNTKLNSDILRNALPLCDNDMREEEKRRSLEDPAVDSPLNKRVSSLPSMLKNNSSKYSVSPQKRQSQESKDSCNVEGGDITLARLTISRGGPHPGAGL